MSEKIFVGFAKIVTVNKRDGGTFEKTQISFNKENLQTLMDNLNPKGWVNTLYKIGASGKPYLELDQFVPTRPSGLENTQQLPPTPSDDAALPWDDSNF